MNKILLQELIDQNKSQREIAEITNKSQTTIRWWLKHYGLKTNIHPKNKGGLAGKPKLPKDGRINDCYCKKCGETDLKNFYVTKRLWTRCRKCHNAENIERYRKNKIKAVEYKGGKCCICGYNKCMAGLDFHHPGEKDVNWKRMRSWSFDKIKDELDRCILVCRNCYAELHYQ
jgi:hypothetical protein